MAVFYSFRDGKVKRIAATRKPKKDKEAGPMAAAKLYKFELDGTKSIAQSCGEPANSQAGLTTLYGRRDVTVGQETRE